MRGIEPPYSAWEADVLPLNYIRTAPSPGLGTTLVPFRFFARPEATELVLAQAVD